MIESLETKGVLGSNLVIQVPWEFSVFLLVKMKTSAWPLCVCGVCVFKKMFENQKKTKQHFAMF